MQIREFIYKKEEYLNNINLIGKKAYELKINDIYEINLLNRNNKKNFDEMYKTIKEAKTNIEKILKEEKNDEIINSNESIFEDFEDIL